VLHARALVELEILVDLRLTPSRRRLGYYALPLLYGDAVPGWANLTMTNGTLASDIGYVRGTAPRGRAFARSLDDELARMKTFLSVRDSE